MSKPKVLYYIHTYFLDSCLEILQSIKYHVDIDLIIEVSPDSIKSTIFELDDIRPYKQLEDLETVLSPAVWKRFRIYLEHIHSARILFFKNKRTFGIENISCGFLLARLIHAGNYTAIHFDTASARAVTSLPFIFNQNLVMTIHDPVVHTGETSFVLTLVRYIYTRLCNAFFFYSSYSLGLYSQLNHSLSFRCSKLMLQPYSFIAQFKELAPPFRSQILFFGQLSYYKGIDLFLQAIPTVLKQYPNEQFLIAGKSSGYSIDTDLIAEYPNNIQLVDEYLSIGRLSQLINHSKFIVCPYREATQSGVLMTAFAMGRSVLATRVGAFPEYIDNGVNGILSDTTSSSIAHGILTMLDAKYYLTLEKQVNSSPSKDVSDYNRNALLEVYSLSKTSNV
jgi:glycosyltransferase involved in cell wall biosynthesis